MQLKKLQPKEEDYTGTFLIRAEHPLEIDATARISADNLAEPIELALHIALNVKDVSVSYYEAQDLWDAMMGD